ncbi:DUF3574 domain-containing protein [Streptomyces diastatochromogenes]|uniref:Choline dehydrogenase n=1 Tax=Streptomyces diastatochromogenes TaxID=42236 RepID=A0A233SKH8_STRDA|nr:DUF3574 domain-containing protein [Streptomyces diastatochromogenes]MCZ0990007.1 DUF3574 domain-containing protein [Streptomyces diastatochromogenes]OXY96140.1 choline dehydrogenase [Streptomyces diastatochromogenes]
MRNHLTPARAALTAAGLLLAAAPTAYATLATPDSTAHTRGKPYIETRLFFGTARPDGGPAVTDRQFMAFVDKEVTPDFPDGLTVQNGRGQWRDAHGTIEKERSYELILLYPQGQADRSDRSIEEIRRAYEKTFGQESVGRVDERAQVDF